MKCRCCKNEYWSELKVPPRERLGLCQRCVAAMLSPSAEMPVARPRAPKPANIACTRYRTRSAMNRSAFGSLDDSIVWLCNQCPNECLTNASLEAGLCLRCLRGDPPHQPGTGISHEATQFAAATGLGLSRAEMLEITRSFMAGNQVWLQAHGGDTSFQLQGVCEERGGRRLLVIGYGPTPVMLDSTQVLRYLILDASEAIS
jgi:hypothetical protein